MNWSTSTTLQTPSLQINPQLIVSFIENTVIYFKIVHILPPKNPLLYIQDKDFTCMCICIIIPTFVDILSDVEKQLGYFYEKMEDKKTVIKQQYHLSFTHYSYIMLLYLNQTTKPYSVHPIYRIQ